MPVLSKEEEIALAVRWREYNDRSAWNRLVCEHQSFVRKLARNARVSHDRVDDLTQEGMIGLMRAADKYDPATGNAFLTYGAPWVRSFIQEELKRGRKPPVFLCVLDEPESDENESPKIDSVEDPKASPEKRLGLDFPFDLSLLSRAIRCLGERERLVIEKCYFFEESLAEIGRNFDPPLTRERVRQIEAQALSKLKDMLEGWMEREEKLPALARRTG